MLSTHLKKEDGYNHKDDGDVKTSIRMIMVEALWLDKKIKILTSRGQLGAQNQDPHEGKLAGTFGGKLLVKLVAGTFGGKLYNAS